MSIICNLHSHFPEMICRYVSQFKTGFSISLELSCHCGSSRLEVIHEVDNQ